MSEPADVPCLPYDEVRHLIRNGDLLLCQGRSSFARLIQLATGSPWSHVGILLRHEEIDRIFALESVESVGCQNLPLRKYVDNYDQTGCGYPGRVFIARHAQMAGKDAQGLIKFSQEAVDMLGTKYGNKDIGGIALRLIAEHFGAEPRDRVDNKTLICSEFAALCFASIGITIEYNRLNYIAPDDFARCEDVHRLWEIAVVPAKDRL